MSAPLVVVDQWATRADTSGTAWDDWSLSLIYADAAARSTAADAPVGRRAQSFASAVPSALGQIGWTLSGSGHQTTTSSGSNDEATTLAALLAHLSGRADASATMSALAADAEHHGDDRPSALWWSAATAFGTQLGAGIGDVSISDDAVVMSMSFVVVDLAEVTTPPHGLFGRRKPFDAHGPASLSSPASVDSVTVDVYTWTAEIDPSGFAPQEAKVRELVGAKASEHWAATGS